MGCMYDAYADMQTDHFRAYKSQVNYEYTCITWHFHIIIYLFSWIP